MHPASFSIHPSDFSNSPIARSPASEVNSGSSKTIETFFPFNRFGFNSPKLASFLIHKVYIKCLGACPEDLYALKFEFLCITIFYRWTFCFCWHNLFYNRFLQKPTFLLVNYAG